MNIIESKQNSLIKEVKKLHKKKYRNEKKQFIVEGFRFVEEALKSSFNVPYIFVSENGMERYKTFNIEGLIKKNTEVYSISDTLLKEICNTDTPQGILGVVDNKSVQVKDTTGFYVLVDRIQDPGNMGTIIRTAHASGALGVIITKGTVDIYNDKTLRSTMGSIFNIPIIEDEDLGIIKNLKEKGFKIVVSSLDTDKNFYDINLNQRIIISVGNEGSGISEEIYSIGDEKVKIPMPGGAESLNAAVSVGIMIYEAVRQRMANSNQ